MIIKVYEGTIDTKKLNSITPIMEQGESAIATPENPNPNPMAQKYFVFQLGLDGAAKINCIYKTRPEAEMERAFIKTIWMKENGQENIPGASDEKNTDKGLHLLK